MRSLSQIPEDRISRYPFWGTPFYLLYPLRLLGRKVSLDTFTTCSYPPEVLSLVHFKNNDKNVPMSQLRTEGQNPQAVRAAS